MIKLNIKAVLALILIFKLSAMKAQESGAVFFDAMQEEIKRSMTNLKLDKMQAPQFISFSISDAATLQIHAKLGGIIKSDLKNMRKFENKVLVGEKGLTQENYLDENNIWSWSSIDYTIVQGLNKDAIRRCLWLATDDNYKKGITNYEAKKSAISQQSLSDEEKQMLDFSAAPKSEKIIKSNPAAIDKVKMEEIAKNISSVMKQFGEIQNSDVYVFVYSGTVYFTNSEGTKSQYPYSITAVKAIASTQAPGGEKLSDHVLWFVPSVNDLPPVNLMVSETEKMAQNLTKLVGTKAISEPYCGPVLFEDEAAAEAIIQKFFCSTNGLISVRKPMLGNNQIAQMVPDKVKENTLEAMMNKKIISRDFSIEASPFLNTYQNLPLIGSYQVDAEGTVPNEKLILVENGVLKNLVCGRVPTLKMKQTNGHARPALNNGAIKTVYGPGVISFINNNAATKLSKAKLKEKLLAAAKEEDLEYAYIIRKAISDAADIKEEDEINFFGSSKTKSDYSKIIQVYRVKVSDGTEELVRGAELQGLSVKAFKRVLATSDKSFAYNTFLKPISTDLNNYEYRLSGYPASFIVPDGILFQELDIVKEKTNVVKKAPLVSNPLKKK